MLCNILLVFKFFLQLFGGAFLCSNHDPEKAHTLHLIDSIFK